MSMAPATRSEAATPSAGRGRRRSCNARRVPRPRGATRSTRRPGSDRGRRTAGRGRRCSCTLDDVRDDVAGPLDDDGVADADVQPLDLSARWSVARLMVAPAIRTGSSRAAGVSRPGAAHVDVDGDDAGRPLLGGENLHGDAPKGVGRRAQASLVTEIALALDDAVRIVAEAVPFRLERLAGGARPRPAWRTAGCADSS